VSVVAWDAVDVAFRGRLASLAVCTTGAVALSAVPTGYRRSGGSFRTDGFAAGMQVRPTGPGWADTTPRTLVEVTDTELRVAGPPVPAQGTGTRTLQVGLPAAQVWENNSFTPQASSTWVEGELVPGSSELLSAAAVNGWVEHRGLYVVRWYTMRDTGATGLRRCASAVLALFQPHQTLAAGAHTVRVRGDTAPWAGQVMQEERGHALLTITIPWRLHARSTLTP
jgi:hypothetical protein